jgi:hypothetical protein
MKIPVKIILKMIKKEIRITLKFKIILFKKFSHLIRKLKNNLKKKA